MKVFEEYMRQRNYMTIDNLITEDFSRVERLRQLYPRQYYHYDRFGRPVLIERPGKANLKQIFNVRRVHL